MERPKNKATQAELGPIIKVLSSIIISIYSMYVYNNINNNMHRINVFTITDFACDPRQKQNKTLKKQSAYVSIGVGRMLFSDVIGRRLLARADRFTSRGWCAIASAAAARCCRWLSSC